MHRAEIRSQRQFEQQKVQAAAKLYAPQGLAHQGIVTSAACLLTNHMLHPDAEYPLSLDHLPADVGCERAPAAETVPEYTFTYNPQKEPTTGRVTDFQLIAIPKAKGAQNRNPMLVDSRGIVFVDYPWEVANASPKVMVIPSDRDYSQIDQLRGNIGAYISQKANGVAPRSLNAEIVGGLRHKMPTIKPGGMELDTNFKMFYLPPKARDAGKFALSVPYQRYVQNCLRSFFLDYDGTVHATGEPRQATAGDPVPPECEDVPIECTSVAWTVP